MCIITIINVIKIAKEMNMAKISSNSSTRY